METKVCPVCKMNLYEIKWSQMGSSFQCQNPDCIESGREIPYNKIEVINDNNSKKV